MEIATSDSTVINPNPLGCVQNHIEIGAICTVINPNPLGCVQNHIEIGAMSHSINRRMNSR